MTIVPRCVREIGENDRSPAESSRKPLSTFRDLPAWALLGEPGAGKSEALRTEAVASDAVFLSIAEFLILNLEDEWRGKTIFLDGLDETRADGGSESILLKIRARLNRLGNPPFRIACRAADWYGSTDRQELAAAASSGTITVLLLESLSEGEILTVLRDNHGVSDPVAFAQKAREHGVDGLLQNPQTLGLLAHAIRDGVWPESRQQVFELACEKLATEENKKHRKGQGTRAVPVEKILDAAGQLCAALLFADKTGIALDRDAAGSGFPYLEDFAPPDPGAARAALRTRLFRPSGSGEERIEASHRSVAEYLAAQWLSAQIEARGLPLGRVLNLLMGNEARTVSGLRGLYAWLALHSRTARSLLIDSDPLSVVIYGDVKTMSPADKRRLLEGFRREAEGHIAFRWEVRASHPFGALADPDLMEDYRRILESEGRSDADQSMLESVLTILAEGEPLQDLSDQVLRVAENASYWGRVRTDALDLWLKWGAAPQDALAVLDGIANGRIADSDDELAGTLLDHLYPDWIVAERLLHYLHSPKNPNLIGSYRWFWEHTLPRKAPESHLPMILDQLAERVDLASPDAHMDFHRRRMIGALLTKGVGSYGEKVSDERLFAWLGIGRGEYGDIEREEADRSAIAGWLEEHPDRYKRLLRLCFLECAGNTAPDEHLYVAKDRLHGAAPPGDIGLWHLEQASTSEEERVANEHLFEAVNTLRHRRGDAGLSLERLEMWAADTPKREEWLAPLLFCEVTETQKKRMARHSESKRSLIERRMERRVQLSKYLDSIRLGTASPALMYELASVWLNLYSDVHGETPIERFDSYCEDGEEVLSAAEAGFRACVTRNDLPTVTEVFDLGVQQKEHFIRRACLVGMDLRWRDGLAGVANLPDDTLRRMVAFRLSWGADNTPEWFVHFVVNKPQLIADVLTGYVLSAWKSGQVHVDGLHLLSYDENYHSLATMAFPTLLGGFPLRAKSGQLSHLEHLLKAALRYALPELRSIIEKKTATKSLDVAQKVYWLTTAMLFDPASYEASLWAYIGRSWKRADYLSGFVSERFGELTTDYPLSPYTLARLVELLTPHAELEWSHGGFVNEAMRRGDLVRALVARLAASANDEAIREIDRLMTLPVTKKLNLLLQNARHEALLKKREQTFRFLSLENVAQVLSNRAPANARDLAMLVLDHLDGIADDVRRENGDLFRHFWTESEKNSPKPENSCRDFLLDKLRARLAPFGIDCQPECDYHNDKRTDIRASCRNEFELPIEIKRESNDTLWTALRRQLIDQYIVAPKTGGHGIYLVLWFGQRDLQAANDGAKKPVSPDELRARLEAQLDPDERKRVFVRVLDVSWPVRS